MGTFWEGTARTKWPHELVPRVLAVGGLFVATLRLKHEAPSSGATQRIGTSCSSVFLEARNQGPPSTRN